MEVLDVFVYVDHVSGRIGIRLILNLLKRNVYKQCFKPMSCESD